MQGNTCKPALREGRSLIGCWASLCSNLTAEVVVAAGFDGLLLDMEHARNDAPGMLGQ